MSKELTIICFGEVLLDNLPEGRRIGGAPLNVCYHLNRNGIKSQIVSQIGKDADGEGLLKGIRELKVDTKFIDQTDELPTSIVEAHVDKEGNVTYDIVKPVAWDNIEFRPEVASQVEHATAFVFGSLVARSPLSRQTLFRYLKKAQWAIFDINLRQPFYSKALILDLISRCQTLKVNDDELNILLGWMKTHPVSEEAALDHLLDVYPNIGEILLTKGAKGAVYKSRTKSLSMPVTPVKIKDTIGSGDSFLAAFIAGKVHGHSIEAAMERAITLSAYVATQQGACPDYSPEDLSTASNSSKNLLNS